MTSTYFENPTLNYLSKVNVLNRGLMVTKINWPQGLQALIVTVHPISQNYCTYKTF